MKFKFTAPEDLTGKTDSELLFELRELLRILANEVRVVRALHLGLADPEQIHKGEGGKEG